MSALVTPGLNWYHPVITYFQTTSQQQPPPSQPTPEPQPLVNLASLKEATSSAPILPIAEDVEEEDAIIEELQDEDQDIQEQEDIEMFLDSMSPITSSPFIIAKISGFEINFFAELRRYIVARI